MGAWGSAAFDNDDAADWSATFEEASERQGVRAIKRALKAAQKSVYLEAPDGAVAVAAAQTVAWMVDPSTVDRSAYSESVTAWLEQHRPHPKRPLVMQARAALDRVVGPESELVDLWVEADDPSWASMIDGLRPILAQAG